MKRLACAVIVCFALAVPGTGLTAQTVRWELIDIVFEDGASATGWFDYDPSTGEIHEWTISVQGGDEGTFPPYMYTPSSTTAIVYPDEASVKIYWFVDDSDRLLGLEAIEMTAEGGPASLVLGLDSGSAECFNCLPYRLISGGSLHGGAPEYQYFVPAFGATAGGSGSQWNSSLQLINLIDGDNDITIRYLGSGQTPDPETSVTLASGHMTTLDNLMDGLVGVGSLSITSSGQLAGVARIFSTDGVGTVGQSFGLVASEDLMGAGETAVAPLAGDASRFRSNLGWFQVAAGEVEFRFLDSQGNLLGTIVQSFGDGTYSQKAAASWLGTAIGSGARVEARVISGQGTGFASDVDNTTNDPTTKEFTPLRR